MVYFNIEPFGEHAAYWRAGVVAATIANVNRGKSQRALKPEDFMPPEPREKNYAQTPRDIVTMLRRIVKSAEARKKKKNNN